MPQKPSLTQKQKKIAAACALVVFILLSAAVCWFVGRPMIRFAKQPELFRQVRAVLACNKAERHLRGGAATRRKYSRR